MFGQLSIAKNITRNAPKYRRIVEPFGDMGTLALELAKKKPKEHVLNIVDEQLFVLFTFMQNPSSGDKRQLKGFDWVGSSKTFDTAVSIKATDGPEFFYRYFYLKKMSVKQKDPEAAPVFDILKFEHDMSKILRDLPFQRAGLKTVNIINEEPLSLLSKYGGSDTFMILIPKSPEDVQAVESKLTGLNASYFFTKKSMSNEALFEAATKYGDAKVSTITASTIMGATMEIVTNYENKLNDIALLQEEAGKQAKSVKQIKSASIIEYQLKTESQKEWLLKTIHRRVDKIIDDMIVVLANQFRIQHKEVNIHLSNLKNKVHFDKKKWNKNIADAVRTMVFEAAKDGYLAAYNTQKGGYLFPMEVKAKVDLATSIGFVADNTNISEWLDEYTMVFSSSVNETVQLGLNEIIKKEIAEGGTIEVIRRNIQEKVNTKYSNIYGKLGKEKLTARGARRMAQTEVNGAQNAGHMAGLKDSGIVKYKAWLSTRNVKVRDTHSAADRRYTRNRGIGIDDLFRVGNAMLSAPGVLVSGDVGERVNCRCSLIAAKKGKIGKLPKGKLKPLLPTVEIIK